MTPIHLDPIPLVLEYRECKAWPNLIIIPSAFTSSVSENHRWDAGSEWFDKYDHPLWKQYGEEAANSGHGGMDFFLDRAFIEGVRRQAS